MTWKPRLPDALAATVFARLAITLAAGVDLRRAWAAESARVPRRWRGGMDAVAQSLAAGRGVADSVRDAGGMFSPLVCGLVEVGERTGRDAEVYRDLAETLSAAVRSRRALRAAVMKPALQLGAAVVTVGLLILITEFIRDDRGRPIDILGIGLTGRRGLVVYLAGVAACAVTSLGAIPAMVRSWQDRGVVRRVAEWLPLVGTAARAAEAAAWCRTAAVASHVGLDAGRLVALAAAAAPGLRIDAGRVEQALRAGATLAEALAETGRFPRVVLEGVAVGELTGTTAETLERLARGLDDEARAGFQAAIKLVGFLAWAAVAAVIAVIVFRVFSAYVAMLQEAGRPL
jgi:type II secretory pathway component PulF